MKNVKKWISLLLAVGLLAACGIRCCYFTNETDDGIGHAALGIEVTDETQQFLDEENCFTYNGVKFIYTEATGHECAIGNVPDRFRNMLNTAGNEDFAIVEPATFKEEENHEK